MRNAICLLILTAFIAGVCWALDLVRARMEFSSFMIFGAVTVAIMVAGGFALDRYELFSLTFAIPILAG